MYNTQLQPFPTGFPAGSGTSFFFVRVFIIRTTVPLLLLTASGRAGTVFSNWRKVGWFGDFRRIRMNWS